jgi:Cu2+-exporting ATPase
LPAEDFHTEPGLGVSAVVEGKPVLVGNEEWLRRQGVVAETLPAFPGKTPVYIAVGGSLVGAIAVKDILRDDAKATVKRLQEMGLKAILLTGDKKEVGSAIALELGLSPEAVLAEVRPQEKAEAIAALQAKGDKVAMVGDGINDAPALAAADIGIGMQAGTDVAVETADIVLMRDALMDVVESIRLSRATFNKIRQNLFWAFIYNIIGIPVAAGVLLPTFGILLNPAAAGALMAFSSVSVVSNSLLLRRSF